MTARNAAILSAAVAFTLGVVATCATKNHTQKATEQGGVEISREVYIDTIPYYQPVPKDSVVVRYETATLPVDKGQRTDTIIKEVMVAVEAPADSARVIIPITQTTYADSTYTAYVSGYSARLDSIFIYPRREVVTIKKPPNRWSIGIQAGYGYTPKGFQPYIGVGISWRILEF